MNSAPFTESPSPEAQRRQARDQRAPRLDRCDQQTTSLDNQRAHTTEGATRYLYRFGRRKAFAGVATERRASEPGHVNRASNRSKDLAGTVAPIARLSARARAEREE